MLVETQGGGAVVNIDNVEMIFTEDVSKECGEAGQFVFARGASGKNMMLGWYKDAKRAREVMQEIVEKIEENTRERTYKMP